MPEPPTLSVVVPATDVPATLPRCTAAIRAAHEPPDELIVIDGPRDLTVSAARNTGVEAASGDVVVFVDADVEVHPDVFRRIRDTFTSFPGLTAVHGSYDDQPGDPRTVSTFRNLLHHHVHQANAGPAETFWTGLGAIRRDAFLAVGGFDETRYPRPSIEDIDLGHRLWDDGAALRLDPRIQGKHLKTWRLGSMLWVDLTRRAIPWLELQFRSRRLSGTLNCGWRHRLSALVCVGALVALVLGLPLVALAGAIALVGLNRSFYALLLRRQGVVRAVGGIGLHALHHLVALVAVPATLATLAVSTLRRDHRSGAPERVRATAS
ncbi:MAG: glycosyltransferase [Acidimicrobiia bacterium]|nr:glycosyltransferase [Acidimicrobiia bacterium]